MSTIETLRHGLYKTIPFINGLDRAFQGTTTGGGSTTTIIDSTLLQNSDLDTNHWRSGNYYLFLPDSATTAADREKTIGDLAPSTGTLTITGVPFVTAGNYASGVVYEILRYISYTEAFNLLLDLLKELPQKVLLPFSPLLTDGDMETAGVGSWTAGGSATLSKVTTAGNVYSGRQSLRVAAAVAGDYANTPNIPVTRGEMIFVSTVCRADVGTCSLIITDAASGAFGTAVTHTQENWQRLWRYEAVPSTTEEITVRLATVGATDNAFFDHLIVQRCGNRQGNAPSWLDLNARLRRVRIAHYDGSSSSGTCDAGTRYFDDSLWPGRDWQFAPYHQDANPYTIRLPRTFGGNEYWLEAQRMAYDLTSVTPITNTAAGEAYTTAHRDNIVIYGWATKICEYLRKKGVVEAAHAEAEMRYKFGKQIEAYLADEPRVESATWRGYAPA